MASVKSFSLSFVAVGSFMSGICDLLFAARFQKNVKEHKER